MPALEELSETVDKLRDTVGQHDADIAQLEQRMATSEARHDGHDRRFSRHEEIIQKLQILSVTMLNRDDFYKGMAKVEEKIDKQIPNFLNALPPWFAAGTGILMALIAVAGFALSYMHTH